MEAFPLHSEETEGLRGSQRWSFLHSGCPDVTPGGATVSADGGEGPYDDAGAEGGGMEVSC